MNFQFYHNICLNQGLIWSDRDQTRIRPVTSSPRNIGKRRAPCVINAEEETSLNKRRLLTCYATAIHANLMLNASPVKGNSKLGSKEGRHKGFMKHYAMEYKVVYCGMNLWPGSSAVLSFNASERTKRSAICTYMQLRLVCSEAGINYGLS